MKSETILNDLFNNNDFKSLDFKNDDYLINSNLEKTHINMSPFNLCESFGSRVLGLSGFSLFAYRLISSFAINNYARFNGLYCCFSFYWLSRSLNCNISTAKRVIKSLCEKQIIKKIGCGRNGRNAYKVLKTYEFDYLGALMVYYEPLDKKRNKRINLKNQDNNKSNNFGLPSWISYYGNYDRFLINRCFNDNELIQIAKTKWIKD